MDANQILDVMEETALAVFEGSEDYINDGKRGVMAVYARNKKNRGQWDGSLRDFGESFRDYGYEEDLVINNGVNFDALVHGKIAFSRRSGKDSGTNYYQVLGNESWWKGSVLSDDGRCICAFAGFSGEDDRAIALAGIDAYESQKSSSGGGEAEPEEGPEGAAKGKPKGGLKGGPESGLKNAPESKKDSAEKTGSLLKTASLARDGGALGSGRAAKAAKSKKARATGAKTTGAKASGAGKKSKKGK
jgi:hypothetical protein